MSIIEVFVFFVITWWLVFYFSLPFGNQQEDNPIPGQAMGAPKNARVKLKMLITSGITLTITLIFYLYMNY